MEYPVYASFLTFELHKEQQSEYYVTLIYNNKTYNPCKFDLNNVKCQFDEFKELLTKKIITNVEEVCG